MHHGCGISCLLRLDLKQASLCLRRKLKIYLFGTDLCSVLATLLRGCPSDHFLFDSFHSDITIGSRNPLTGSKNVANTFIINVKIALKYVFIALQ